MNSSTFSNKTDYRHIVESKGNSKGGYIFTTSLQTLQTKPESKQCLILSDIAPTCAKLFISYLLISLT